MKFVDVFKTKTFWFGTIAIVGNLVTQEPITVEQALLAVAGILTLAAGRQAIGKAVVKVPAVAWFFAGLAALGLAAAPSLAAPPVTPYAALTADRLSGPDEWSTGFEIGAETTHDRLYVYGSVSLQDVLSTRDVYPWDSTFRLGAGVYSQHDIFGIPATPYAGVRLARPSSPTEWSLGVELGSEIAFEPVWLRVGLDLNDWLSDRQVFPWDTTFRLAAGFYFGEPESGETGGARGTRHRQ